MKVHLEVFNVYPNAKGLINVNNIEEVWLDEHRNCVSIRYISPNGNLIDHEERFQDLRSAQYRYSAIQNTLLDDKEIIRSRAIERTIIKENMT